MRKLTIKREKSFVACLVSLKVFVADSKAGLVKINGVLCRKIGTIKNGEEKTFEIGEEATRVFVIADSMSKDFCNDYYDIPEGSEDVYLSGRNKYNPLNGNAFRFNGNELSAEVVENRKKATKKGTIILVASIVLGVIVGALSGSGVLSKLNVKEKTFADSGMKIVLTTEFDEVDYEGYTVCYGSEDVAVFALKEAFSDFEGAEDYTLNEYGELVIENNRLSRKVTERNRASVIVFNGEVRRLLNILRDIATRRSAL